MGGDNEHELNCLGTGTDEFCYRGCCGGCGCGCEQCSCRFDHAIDDGAKGDHYAGEGGAEHHKPIPTLPVDIVIDRFQVMTMVDKSFNDNTIDPNEAPQPAGPGFAVTHANVRHLTRSYNEAGSYQEEWLRQERMRIDEHPFAAFVSPEVETEVFDFEQDAFFGPMDLDGSMHVEDSLGGDNLSVASRSTCCRSRSSRSASQVLPGMEPTPGFIFRPLPLLPEGCPNCGGEHEDDGVEVGNHQQWRL